MPSFPSAAPSRFLSQADCEAVMQRVVNMMTDGRVDIGIRSSWRGYTQWVRNHSAITGDIRNDEIELHRWLDRGTVGIVEINQVDAPDLDAAVRRAERLANIVQLMPPPEQDYVQRGHVEYDLKPTIWSDTTYGLDAETRSEAMRSLTVEVKEAGMLLFGYVDASAHGDAFIGSDSGGWKLYYPYTQVQYSATVRDPHGVGSGWAGQDHYDWNKIDTKALTQRALEKCLMSRNPVAVEPGRYTTILEPQAVADFIAHFFFDFSAINREKAEMGPGNGSPFTTQPNESNLGQRVFDERLTFRTDLMDPDLGFPPWRPNLGELGVDFFHPVTWVKDGILETLSYSREYARRLLGKSTGTPNRGAYRMETTPQSVTPIEEMIATMKRGLLVTRFWGCQVWDPPSWSVTGMTRDGLWLIENGKITKPVKNLRFNDSVIAKLNAPNLEQIGPSVRVFSPDFPVVVPPVKVRDFNFTALTDAI